MSFQSVLGATCVSEKNAVFRHVVFSLFARNTTIHLTKHLVAANAPATSRAKSGTEIHSPNNLVAGFKIRLIIGISARAVPRDLEGRTRMEKLISVKNQFSVANVIISGF
jgi:protocatechuate 3,4-dioxygenase beta subunit